MRLIKALMLVVTIAFALPVSSHAASESGSHGWSRTELSLRNGPGAAYDAIGSIPGRVVIRILRCQKLWCLVDGEGARGWTDAYHVDFGQSPDWPLTGPELNYAVGGSGTICFYTGTNYTGSSFCARSGQVFNDLALWGMDNAFSSVKVEGSLSAAACRDRKFQSYCERIVGDQPALDPYLRRNLSSIRVY